MVTAALLALLVAAPRPPTPPTPPAPPEPTAPSAAGHADAKRLGDWPRKESGKVVTIGEHVSIDDALERIAAAAGWNLVANTGRLGDRTLVVTFHDTPVEEALDAVLEGAPLVATRRGNTVTVAPGRAAAPPETPTLSGFEKPTGKRFSGDFTDTPIADALRKVSDAAGLSIVLPPGLRGTVSAHFRDAPVEEVLKTLLSQGGLVAAREGSILTVAREGGPSLVIGGGKRRLAFPGGGDLERDVDETVSDAMREARDAAREAAREGARAADRARGEGKRRPGDRVLRGDQVIGPGERANDVVVLLGSVRLEPGSSAHQITAVMGSVDLSPGVQVDGEVVAIGGDIHVAPGARVGGDAVSVGGKIVIDEGAEIEGQQTSVDIPGIGSLLSAAGTRAARTHPRHHGPLWRAASVLLEFAVFFGLGLLVFVLFPRRVETLTGSLVNAPLKAVLTGVLGTIALPIGIVLLVATVVGIPFIAVVALALVVATVMGYTALALYFGRTLPFHFERGAPILQLAIGTAILVAVGQIPVIGFLAWVAGWLFVFGVVLRTRFGQPPHAPPPVYGTTAPPPMPPPA